jgi:hypothetical protein
MACIMYPRMKSIVKIIQQMRIPEQNKILGRWEITYCKPTMNKKVDLANEDHCGICYSTKYHNPKYINPYNTHNLYKKNPIIDLE